MNRNSVFVATALLPLFVPMPGRAPMHDDRQSLSWQTPAASVDTTLPAALKNGWSDSQRREAYHDPQLNALIDSTLRDSPDMQVAKQHIQLAEAQARVVEAQNGPEIDFSANVKRRKMSVEGLMGPFAITDPATGTAGPWYINSIFGLAADWNLDLWGKNRVEAITCIGTVRAREAERK